jgi:hypothetical protein
MHINGRLTGVRSTLAVLLIKTKYMKAYLLHLPVIIAVFFISNDACGQTSLAPDQNPDFAVSRDKYMKMSDSITAWHSTTIQDTYKAIDWMADRQEARSERRQFRRELRRYRAGWYNYGNYQYNAGYYYPYRSRGYYHPNNYRRYNRNNFWWNFWCF